MARYDRYDGTRVYKDKVKSSQPTDDYLTANPVAAKKKHAHKQKQKLKKQKYQAEGSGEVKVMVKKASYGVKGVRKVPRGGFTIPKGTAKMIYKAAKPSVVNVLKSAARSVLTGDQIDAFMKASDLFNTVSSTMKKPNRGSRKIGGIMPSPEESATNRGTNSVPFVESFSSTPPSKDTGVSVKNIEIITGKKNSKSILNAVKTNGRVSVVLRDTRFDDVSDEERNSLATDGGFNMKSFSVFREMHLNPADLLKLAVPEDYDFVTGTQLQDPQRIMLNYLYSDVSMRISNCLNTTKLNLKIHLYAFTPNSQTTSPTDLLKITGNTDEDGVPVQNGGSIPVSHQYGPVFDDAVKTKILMVGDTQGLNASDRWRSYTQKCRTVSCTLAPDDILMFNHKNFYGAGVDLENLATIENVNGRATPVEYFYVIEAKGSLCDLVKTSSSGVRHIGTSPTFYAIEFKKSLTYSPLPTAQRPQNLEDDTKYKYVGYRMYSKNRTTPVVGEQGELRPFMVDISQIGVGRTFDVVSQTDKTTRSLTTT